MDTYELAVAEPVTTYTIVSIYANWETRRLKVIIADQRGSRSTFSFVKDEADGFLALLNTGDFTALSAHATLFAKLVGAQNLPAGQVTKPTVTL